MKIMKKIQIACNQDDIRIRFLPNTSLECYHFTNLLGRLDGISGIIFKM